jgi:hypothetical protein
VTTLGFDELQRLVSKARAQIMASIVISEPVRVQSERWAPPLPSECGDYYHDACGCAGRAMDLLQEYVEACNTVDTELGHVRRLSEITRRAEAFLK